jgi:hypothetical protein
MIKTAANAEGTPIEAFDGIRAGLSADRSQSFKDLTQAFYGANRPGSEVSQGVKDAFCLASYRHVLLCGARRGRLGHNARLVGGLALR